jgi:hypothetical protein
MVKSCFSSALEGCVNGTGVLQIRYDREDDFFSIPLYFHGMQGYYLFFDPWSGLEIKHTVDVYIDESDHLELNRTKWARETIDEQQKHFSGAECSTLALFLKDGDEEGLTSIIHIPNIRSYAILNKKEYGGFEPIDYCPFCGAKFPERLDQKLTEILQKEYELDSWKDYKKAPHEFHTDEWWKKRGL